MQKRSSLSGEIDRKEERMHAARLLVMNTLECEIFYLVQNANVIV